MPNCEKCGREFKNELALKIHVGKLHGAKKAKRLAPKKGGRPTKTAKGAFACKVCGRTFKLPAHLARHASVAHAKAGKAKRARKVGRPAARRARVAAAPAGLDVRSLTVDQLLAIKRQVDARLLDIARQMRAAKVGL